MDSNDKLLDAILFRDELINDFDFGNKIIKKKKNHDIENYKSKEHFIYQETLVH